MQVVYYSSSHAKDICTNVDVGIRDQMLIVIYTFVCLRRNTGAAPGDPVVWAFHVELGSTPIILGRDGLGGKNNTQLERVTIWNTRFALTAI